jgi:hypothetical protein
MALNEYAEILRSGNYQELEQAQEQLSQQNEKWDDYCIQLNALARVREED